MAKGLWGALVRELSNFDVSGILEAPSSARKELPGPFEPGMQVLFREEAFSSGEISELMRGRLGVVKDVVTQSIFRSSRDRSITGYQVTADFGEPYTNEIVSSNYLQTFDEFVNDVAATRHNFLSYLIDATRTTVDRDGMIRMDFVNQTIDVELLSKVARLVRIWIAESEQLYRVSKILAPEVSGLPIGSLVSSAFRANMVLARKVKSKHADDALISDYAVPSATKPGEEFYFAIKKNALVRGDGVLVSDDFRRTGRTIDAMCNLVKKAGAHLAGALVIVDKSYGKISGESKLDYKFGAALGVERFEPMNGRARLYLNRVLMIPCDPSRTYVDVKLTG